MELIRGYHNLSPRHHGCVMTIGNFDGVHRGHQEILKHLKEQAADYGLPLLLATFEPLPQEYFSSDESPSRLTSLREKLDLLHDFGIDRVLVQPFNSKLANTSAEEFVRRILVDGLGVKYLVVGDDFRFGAKRSGNFAMLRELANKLDFAVSNFATVSHQGQRISSTVIREALSAGDLEQASEMLGHSYYICGKVIHGDKRGRQIGVPTANLAMQQRVAPLKGVFAVKVHGINQQAIYGVANLGKRPTVAGDSKTFLEVHLFDFDQDIYGEQIKVEFIQKIREEQRFSSFLELKEQIFKDIAQSKRFFNLV